MVVVVVSGIDVEVVVGSVVVVDGASVVVGATVVDVVMSVEATVDTAPTSAGEHATAVSARQEATAARLLVPPRRSMGSEYQWSPAELQTAPRVLSGANPAVALNVSRHADRA
ncbi:MAG: hypothetical protein O6834_04925 [Actinobacteria bacterium]|nr:hypothetical protein [Actinomycetota bacterium]